MKCKISLPIWAFAILYVMVACANSSEEQLPVTNTEEKTIVYGSHLPELPTLSEAARTQAIAWSVFEDFETNTKRLKGKTKPAIGNIAEQLIQQTDSLLLNIPDSIDTRPVHARLILVNTRAKLLGQLAKEHNADSLRLETNLQEMNTAVQNLFIEMNRKFRKGKIDEQLKETEKKELEKQQKFLDSVYKAELEDNNN